MKGIVLICACLALGPGAAGAAAAAWLPPEDVSKVSETITAAPEIALDSAGNTVAIGLRDDGADTLLEAIERPAGGEWSKSVAISDPDEEPKAIQLGVDAAGHAVAAWSGFHELDFVIGTASRPAGGEWSEPEFLAVDAMPGTAPHLAVNADGDAVATWIAFDAGEALEVVVAAVRPAGGEWADPEEIAPEAEDEEGRFPQVGIDAEGNATAVWQRLDPGENIIRTASLPAGDDWSEPEDLSTAGDNAGAPRIAVSPNGDAVAAWTVTDGGDSSLHAKTRAAGGDWSEQEDVSVPGEDPGEPELAIDSNGAVASWMIPTPGGDEVVRAAVRPTGDDHWSAPEDLAPAADQIRSLALASNAAAGAIAIWTSFDGATNLVRAAVRPPGEDWLAHEDLSDVGEEAGLAELGFDPAGNAIGIWGRDAGAGYVAEAAGYDFVAPRLDGLQIPASGTAGAPVAFSVSPFDVFSVGAADWTFGDGSSAGGNAVSHVFAAPGEYPVTVSAIDGGGNPSSQTRTITIAARPEPRRPIVLSLRIQKKSLASLLRSGKLGVTAFVSDPARVALTGEARLRVGQGNSRKLIRVFEGKSVQVAAAGEREVQLTLKSQARKRLQSLSRVRIVISGEASAGAGNEDLATAARTLRSAPSR